MKLKEGCPKLCRGRILDKEEGVYCECISRKIPSMHKGRLPVVDVTKVRASGPDSNGEYKIPETLWLSQYGSDKGSLVDQLDKKLRDFGLQEYQVALICERYGEDKSFEEIFQELGWTTSSAAAYHLRRALRSLKAGGFK